MAICLLMDYSLDGCLGKECLSNAMGLHLRVSMTIYIVFKYTISSRFKQTARLWKNISQGNFLSFYFLRKYRKQIMRIYLKTIKQCFVCFRQFISMITINILE